MASHHLTNDSGRRLVLKRPDPYEMQNTVTKRSGSRKLPVLKAIVPKSVRPFWKRLVGVPLVYVASSLNLGVATALHAETPPVYGTDVQPILAKHCILCHGPDEAEGGLRLDQHQSVIAERDSGDRAIVPSQSDQSELLKRVQTQDPSRRMPPEGPPLTTREIEVLTRWIDAGAKFDQHWSFRPVLNQALPDVRDTKWVRNPIDAFVLSRLESAGLNPSPHASPATLAKRVAYDLTGLPPNPDLLRDYLDDPSEDGYGRLIDALLGSKHFGERWGRHWLDKARYADSDGYEKDRPRPNAWLYRDWVIDAFNDDMPFNQFTLEQLAGDLLEEPSDQQRLATAFHRQTLTNTEGGVDKEEFRVEATFDRTETTAAVWLGLTMTCARCHNHKYDQISQDEYYQLYAFFDDLNESNAKIPASSTAAADYEQKLAEHQRAITALEKQYAAAKLAIQPDVDEWVEKLQQILAKDTDGPLSLEIAHPLSAVASSGAPMRVESDGSVLVSGDVADKDKYTVVFEVPAGGFNGIKLEALPHESLPAKGPGRPANGNFVLSEVRVYVGKDADFKTNYEAVPLTYAEADHAQTNFAAQGALQKTAKSGWAISPKMGQAHQWLGLTDDLPALQDRSFIQVVLDQQYGGKHLLGHFRLSTVAGNVYRRVLPPEVVKILQVPAEQRDSSQRQVLVDHVAQKHAKTKPLFKRLVKLKGEVPVLQTVSARVVSPAKRDTRVLHRGDFLQPAGMVETGVVSVVNRVHPLQKRNENQTADRRDLAAWLVDPANPLTSRVSVNQVWSQLFGKGIVATVDDFGIRGEQPTHPGLLDWLAWNYPRDMQWSRKTLIKTILVSSTYRQSSRHREELETIDPTNQLLARQNRVRVSGEVVRDLHLAVSGLLSEKVGGPSVFPPLPSGVAELSYANNFKWNTSQGEDAYRRGMYTFFKRTSPYPNLISFDCPDSNTTRLKRDISNTPLQALVTLNNRVFSEAAQASAKMILQIPEMNEPQRLAYAMQRVLTRKPREQEIARFQNLLATCRAYYAEHPDDAGKVIAVHPHQDSDVVENAAWVATMRIILNLDEFIVRD